MAGLKQVFVQALTETSLTPKDTLGDLRYEGNKQYKYVKVQNTTATVAGVAGDVVIYDNEDGGNNNHVVTDYTDGSAVPIGAGALQSTIVGTLTVPEYVWIQTRGPCTLNQALTAGSDGNTIKAGASDKVATVVAAATDPRMGVANDVSAKFVSLMCP